MGRVERHGERHRRLDQQPRRVERRRPGRVDGLCIVVDVRHPVEWQRAGAQPQLGRGARRAHLHRCGDWHRRRGVGREQPDRNAHLRSEWQRTTRRLAWQRRDRHAGQRRCRGPKRLLEPHGRRADLCRRQLRAGRAGYARQRQQPGRQCRRHLFGHQPICVRRAGPLLRLLQRRQRWQRRDHAAKQRRSGDCLRQLGARPRRGDLCQRRGGPDRTGFVKQQPRRRDQGDRRHVGRHRYLFHGHLRLSRMVRRRQCRQRRRYRTGQRRLRHIQPELVDQPRRHHLLRQRHDRAVRHDQRLHEPDRHHRRYGDRI